MYGFIVTNNLNNFVGAFLTERWNPQSQKTRLTYFGYDPSEPVVRLQYVIDGDGNANVTMLIYTNQIIAAKYLYDPFGNTLSLSGPLSNFNTYRFASKEWHGSAGIYYFGRRFYDPILQRFVNRDPLGEQGGINLFGYCGNAPITFYDPLGLCWWDDIQNALEMEWFLINSADNTIDPAKVVLGQLTQTWNDYWATGGGIAGLNVAVNENNPFTPAANLVYQENILTGQGFTWWGDDSENVGHLGLNMLPVFPLAVMARGVDLFSAAENEETVQIFRAVDQNELPSVLNGTYGSSPNLSGKYFSLTQEGAENVANAPMNAGQQMTITSTTVPRSVFNQGYLFNDTGLAGPSIHFQQEFLPTLYNLMTPIIIH